MKSPPPEIYVPADNVIVASLGIVSLSVKLAVKSESAPVLPKVIVLVVVPVTAALFTYISVGNVYVVVSSLVMCPVALLVIEVIAVNVLVIVDDVVVSVLDVKS